MFTDANIFIDILVRKKDSLVRNLEGHTLCASPLSLHILLYVFKYSIPNKIAENASKIFVFVPWISSITNQALIGPTKDFEDNVQLHSAAAGECDFFLTNDSNLLDLKFFGKTKMISIV